LKRNAPGRWPIERHHACPSQRVQSIVVQVRTASGKLLKTLVKFSNADASRRWRPVNLDVTKFRGRTVRLQFTSTENSSKSTKICHK
jgi:hypothetical protein